MDGEACFSLKHLTYGPPASQPAVVALYHTFYDNFIVCHTFLESTFPPRSEALLGGRPGRGAPTVVTPCCHLLSFVVILLSNFCYGLPGQCALGPGPPGMPRMAGGRRSEPAGRIQPSFTENPDLQREKLTSKASSPCERRPNGVVFASPREATPCPHSLPIARAHLFSQR